MRLFFGALVLNFILFFHGIEEAEGVLNNILTKPTEVKNSIDALATSRRPTSSSKMYNPDSIAHEALNLEQYPSQSRESSLQQSNGSPYHYPGSAHEHGYGSYSSSPQSAAEIQQVVKEHGFKHGYPPQNAAATRFIELDRIKRNKKSSPEHTGSENIKWLISHARTGPPPVPKNGFHFGSTQFVEKTPSTKTQKGNEAGEFRNQLDQYRSANGREKLSYTQVKEEDDENFQMYSPNGHHQQQPQFQFKKPYQIPEHAFVDYKPDLIPNSNSLYSSPYHDYQKSDSNGNHNHHDDWDVFGGSGSG